MDFCRDVRGLTKVISIYYIPAVRDKNTSLHLYMRFTSSKKKEGNITRYTHTHIPGMENDGVNLNSFLRHLVCGEDVRGLGK